MKIAIINRSSADSAAMPLIAQALAKYAGMVADAWRVLPPDAIEFTGTAAAPPGYIAMTIGDTIDEPGALAYHTVGPDGVPMMVADYKLIEGGELFHDRSGMGASLLDTLQHELAEFMIDPFANSYVLGPFVEPATGKSHTLQALEVCDPTQESAGAMDVSGTLCDVADFILPPYFCAGAPGPYDHLGVLTRPLSLAGGGYAIVEDGDLTDNQVMAKAAIAAAARGDTLSPDDHHALEHASRWVKVYHPSRPAAWREALKDHPYSRSARRIAAGLPKLTPER